MKVEVEDSRIRKKFGELKREEAERALEEVWNRRTGEEGEHD